MSTDSEATGRCKVVYHGLLLLCVIQKRAAFHVLKRDVLWLNWKSNSKTKSPL